MNRRAVGKIDFPIKDDEDAEDRCTESTLRSGLFAYRGFIGHLDDPAADLEIGAEKTAIYADLTDVASGYLRDLAVARDGNAYVRSFDADASGPDGFASARVLLATPDGTIRSVADNIAHPNGLAITSSQVRMTYWLRRRSEIGFSRSRSTATERCAIERSSQTLRG